MDQDEFSAALRAAVDKEDQPEQEGLEEKLDRLAAEEETEDVAVVEEEGGQPDPAVAGEEATEEVVEGEAEEEVEDPADYTTLPPEVAAYVERHGSVGNALKVALEAQSLIGRQGSELGELRQAVQALQEQASRPPQQQYMGDLDERIVDNPQGMASWALQNEQEQIFEAAMAEWYEQDPRAAARFERSIEQEMLRSEFRQGMQPVQTQQVQASMVQAKRELVSRFPDAEAILESVTDDELVGLDPTMVGQLRDQNPRAALEVVYRWVKSGRQAGETEQQTAATRAQNAVVKKDAAVVKSASSTPAREEKTPMEIFTEKMLAPAEYSVSHGLQ